MWERDETRPDNSRSPTKGDMLPPTLVTQNHGGMHLIGFGLGSVLKMEVADRLEEKFLWQFTFDHALKALAAAPNIHNFQSRIAFKQVMPCCLCAFL